MSGEDSDANEMSDQGGTRRRRQRRSIPDSEDIRPSLLCKRVSASLALGGVALVIFAAVTRDIIGKELAVNFYWASIILILAGIFVYGIWGRQFREPTDVDWERSLFHEIDRTDWLRHQKK